MRTGGFLLKFQRALPLLVLIAGMGSTDSVLGQRDPMEKWPEGPGFDPSRVEQWKESAVAIPPYPEERHLLAVPLPPSDTLKLHIDENSVSRAADRVARLTLVVETPSGARNVFYDGIRCETREYKTYAVGTSDRSLVAVNDPRWREIPRNEKNAFRYHLYRHYVCDGNSSARAPRELVEAIKYQR
ncbi:MAG: hypothetical protein A2637_05350 [Candidatus Muproteobacteria bacterium RIFCSPHIGHO2_01_FULL_65_16]|uniref:CNP1-like uncharacterized domain-containing protein n=2 Tax=Candidatus Muproteobacteria TaxID=1817795 RepID=A0A1F6TNI0_9PROT|nr:MAG: hypothetical protein A2637_05350 [Candidatus Muproteobacteria bacterium RIFCSPHIGHO2_01_FULL_65_16]OGI52811.1 MAG: hypothetical protein A3B81_04555 [Candidatus Muproteobacteria bacterium RIFCSPHIGHO2_02_FULL_65_16]